MIFLEPNKLYWIVFVLVLSVGFIVLTYFRCSRLLQNINWKSFQRLSPSFSFVYKTLHMFLAFLSLIFMILALARPQTELDKQKIEKSEGVEIIFMIDISRSMLAEDTKPNRLSLAKAGMIRFINQSGSKHRYGLIAFAGSAILLSPLTSDLDLIKSYIGSLDTSTISSQGTDFQAGFKLAQRAFKEGATEPSTKVLMILSDGEDNEVGALDQVRQMKGIHIFTLGFGTHEGAHISFKESSRSRVRTVHTKLESRLLKEFSKIGKGAYYHAQSGYNFIKSIKADVEQLKQYQSEGLITKRKQEHYQVYLALALFFMVLHWILRFFKIEKLRKKDKVE